MWYQFCHVWKRRWQPWLSLENQHEYSRVAKHWAYNYITWSTHSCLPYKEIIIPQSKLGSTSFFAKTLQARSHAMVRCLYRHIQHVEISFSSKKNTSPHFGVAEYAWTLVSQRLEATKRYQQCAPLTPVLWPLSQIENGPIYTGATLCVYWWIISCNDLLQIIESQYRHYYCIVIIYSKLTKVNVNKLAVQFSNTGKFGKRDNF
jgi:hypothetical protein